MWLLVMWLGPFKLGVHKRNVLPQNHSQDTTFEWPLHLWNNLFGRFYFFIRYSHTSKMMVIVYDLDD